MIRNEFICFFSPYKGENSRGGFGNGRRNPALCPSPCRGGKSRHTLYMKKYNPKLIEKKWQKYWESHKTFEVKEDAKIEKFYSLIEFPYPSMRVCTWDIRVVYGHGRNSRKNDGRQNVLFPIGFDSLDCQPKITPSKPASNRR